MYFVSGLEEMHQQMLKDEIVRKQRKKMLQEEVEPYILLFVTRVVKNKLKRAEEALGRLKEQVDESTDKMMYCRRSNRYEMMHEYVVLLKKIRSCICPTVKISTLYTGFWLLKKMEDLFEKKYPLGEKWASK